MSSRPENELAIQIQRVRDMLQSIRSQYVQRLAQLDPEFTRRLNDCIETVNTLGLEADDRSSSKDPSPNGPASEHARHGPAAKVRDPAR